MSRFWKPRFALLAVLILALATGCRQAADDKKPAGSDENSTQSVPDTTATDLGKEVGGADNGPSDTDGAANQNDASDLDPAIAKLVADLESNDTAAQAAAAAKLARMGAAAAPAIAAIVAQLEDDDAIVRAHAARALGLIGEPAKPAAAALARAIGDEDVSVRREAIKALERIPGDENVTPLMIEALGDADPHVVALAINSLAEFGPEIVPAMIKAMDDDRTIYWAILVLYEIGPDAKEAVPALAQALTHEHEEVRHEAAQALRAIGPAAKEAVPELIVALDGDITLQLPATLALGSIGPDAKDAVEKLQPLAESEDELQRVVAVWALAKIQPDPEALKTETVPVLVASLKSENQRARRTAALALLNLDPGPEIMVPAISGATEDASPAAIADMLDAAASLGAKAVPNMMRGLDHPEVRRYAVGVLGRIGPDAAEAVPKLLELLDGADAQLRNEILFTLGSIGPAAKAGVPAAIAGLQDEDDEVRFSAVYALGKIGPEAAESLAALERALGSEDPKFCTACAWALVRVEPDNEENAQKALPLLIEALDSSTPFVREEAAGTLGLLGPKAKDALPKLKQMAEQDKSDRVREAAAEAIKLIEGDE